MIRIPGLSAGFATLLNSNGEVLIFRGTEIKAIVNRNPFTRNVRQPDFDKRDGSEIRFFMDAVSSPPEVGEYYTDERGGQHRIQTVRLLHDVYTTENQVSQAEGNTIATEADSLWVTEAGEPIAAA
jgi:hypothetical protein